MSTTNEPISLPAAVWPAVTGEPVSRASRLGRRFLSLDGPILVGLVVWMGLGVVLEAIHAANVGGTFTGIQSLYPPDQFQYLTWIRDAGTHGLIGDHFQLVGPNHYDFLQPMFLLSGLVWRLGVSLPMAYLFWAPVAVLLTWWGFRALVRRHLAGSGPVAAALIIALCYMSPFSAWAIHRLTSMGGLQDLGAEFSTVTALWGYFPRAIAVALLPLLLLCLEALLDARRRSPGRGQAFYTMSACLMGATIAWLHPWQGAIALFAVVGITAWNRPGRHQLVPMLAVAGAIGLPLLYYEALTRYDFYWKVGHIQSLLAPFTPAVLLAAFFPVGLFALFALRRRPPQSTHRRLLLLWVIGAIVGFVLTDAFPPHMFDGLALPLAIFAVEGWQRLNLPRRLPRGRGGQRLAVLLAIVGVAACAVPGLYAFVGMFHATEYHMGYGTAFTSDDNRALNYLARDPERGGVLAAPYIAAAIPPFTGRNTWVGHFAWTPQYFKAENTDTALFADVFSPAVARHLVESIGARFVLVDCHTTTSLPEYLGPDIASRHLFGCAAVYQLRLGAGRA